MELLQMEGNILGGPKINLRCDQKYRIVPYFIFLKAKKKGKSTWLNWLEILTDTYWKKI